MATQLATQIPVMAPPAFSPSNNNFMVAQQLQWAQASQLESVSPPSLTKASSFDSTSSMGSLSSNSSRQSSPLCSPVSTDNVMSSLSQSFNTFQLQQPHTAPPPPAVARKPRKQYTPHCVFVFHIPLSMTDEELRVLFEPFGEVADAVIRREPRGKSKGFAFVNYYSRENAERAIKCMKGHPIGGKFLHCGLKTKGPGQNARFPGQRNRRLHQQKQLQQHQQRKYVLNPPMLQQVPSPYPNYALIQQQLMLQQQMWIQMQQQGFYMPMPQQHRQISQPML